ncbi:flagellar motor switch protein FliN [Dyella sp. M7H15-1]|uniref:flagellar motor switch protein FliN n=1 Tax=Dyella sp. M7H15-1 TaxID=2501295 RepID=UPI0010051837|nr:flagellar motor switch protein FliN [Dyella sp. M7H15-1]QAU24284.1 flagellar motor switch protein FliN [Dyella sp. M7H15-1]
MSLEHVDDLDLNLDELDMLEAPAALETPRRPSMRMLRKIPVRLTLEVGAASMSLSELAALEQGSVVELDRLAGEPLAIKVNGAQIGRAEVVVSGENYGLKIVELEDLEALTS